MTLMPYLESGSAIPSSTASRLDLDDDQLVDSSHRQVHTLLSLNLSFAMRMHLKKKRGKEFTKIERTRLSTISRAFSRTMNEGKITSLWSRETRQLSISSHL